MGGYRFANFISMQPRNERGGTRLLTVMKSRSLQAHRGRMHFRRSSRLSALADKIWQKKTVITTGGKVAYWNSIPREIISSRIVKQRLFARASLVNIPPASKKFRNSEIAPASFRLTRTAGFVYIYVSCEVCVKTRIYDGVVARRFRSSKLWYLTFTCNLKIFLKFAFPRTTAE